MTEILTQTRESTVSPGGLQNPQKVDYDSHPAFRDLSDRYPYDDQLIEGIISEIDGIFLHLNSSRFQSHAQLKFVANGTLEAPLTSLFRHLEENCVLAPVKNALPLLRDNLRNYFLHELSYSHDQKCFQGAWKIKGDEARNGLNDMVQKGRWVLPLNSQDTQTLQEFGERLLPGFRARYENLPNWRGAVPVPLDEGLGHFVVQLVQRYSVDSIITAYKGRPMVVTYVAVDYAHERQTWFRGCYDDIGLPLAKTNYLHYDNDIEMSKMLIYLTPCTTSNGPFSFVKSSPRWRVSPFLQHGLSAVDHTFNWPALATSPDSYHRPLFKHSRHFLMALPRALRGSTHFGDDLLDGTPQSNFLLANTEEFVGPAGTAVLFDGYRGLHKGSTALQGERLGIQVGLIDQARDPNRNLKTQLKRLVPVRARRVFRRKL